MRDISLRKQAEAALRASDERFNIQEVYWLLDAETKHVLYVNPAYETGQEVEQQKHQQPAK